MMSRNAKLRLILASTAALVLSATALAQPQGQVQSQQRAGQQSSVWRNTIEEMRARISESLKEIEARISRLSDDMREDSRSGGEAERLFDSQRRLQQMQLRQREIQVLQETLNTLNSMARTLEDFGVSQQSGSPRQRRSVRDRLGWHVVGIFSSDSVAYAELWSETRGRVRVRAGDRLPDGSEIVEIDGLDVRVRNMDGTLASLQKADIVFIASRLGQLAEEHQAGLRSFGMGGIVGMPFPQLGFGGMGPEPTMPAMPPSFNVAPPMGMGMPSNNTLGMPTSPSGMPPSGVPNRPTMPQNISPPLPQR